MAVDIATFRTRFPEFADAVSFPDSKITVALEDSTDFIGTDEAHWKGKYDRVQGFLTAHILITNVETEAGDFKSKAGQVTSKSAGGVSVTRNVSQKNTSHIDEWLLTTTYGQRFVMIRNTTFVGSLAAQC